MRKLKSYCVSTYWREALTEIPCTQNRAKIFPYFCSSFASSSPLPPLPVNLRRQEPIDHRSHAIPQSNPVAGLRCLFQCHRNGATCRYFTRETLLPSSAWSKNECDQSASFFLSLYLFLILFLAWTLVFRSWSVGAPRRCSLRPSLVAPQDRSCPYSANPVVTGHPEELHQQEQFRVLAYRAMCFVLFEYRSLPIPDHRLINVLPIFYLTRTLYLNI